MNIVPARGAPEGGAPELLSLVRMGLVLAVGLLAWDIALTSFAAPGVGAPPLSQLAVDAVAFFVLAIPACAAGAWLSRRLGLVGQTGAGRLGAAAMVAVALTVVLLVGVAVRDLAVQSRGAAGSVIGNRFLCSTAVSDPEDAASAAVTPAARLRSALAGGLPLTIPALPLSLLALCLIQRRRARPVTSDRRFLLVVASGAVLVTCGTVESDEVVGTEVAESAAPVVAGCPAGSPMRTYAVSAIKIAMPLNRFGDHDPEAFMFALDSAIPAIRAQEVAALPGRVSTGLRKDPIQPLVLRANLGDCLVVNFTNRLGGTRPAAFHVDGLAYTAASEGGAVGNNPNSFAAPGQTVTYTLAVPANVASERAYYIHDAGAARDRISHGLFGAVVAEPAGSTYLDPETGAPLQGSNWEAIIAPPAAAGPSFREFVLLYHEIGDEDFTDIQDARGDDLPRTGDEPPTYRPGARAINYRSEPFFTRFQLAVDESQAYGSYFFGDPATPIPRSYLGEPTKTRLLHGGSEVFHVHHLHGGADRWRMNAKAGSPNFFATGLTKAPAQDTSSVHLDSQSMGPGSSFTLEHQCGAGGCQQAAGDFLFHCHIQHHYLSGMWAFWRVFDTMQPDLATIPGRTPPPTAVSSDELVGRVVEGKTLVRQADFVNPTTQIALEAFIEAQLPPPGVPFNDQDATVWNWTKVTQNGNPRYLGEPETALVWANYASPTPGQRPVIRFNPQNGRYAWPLFRPHLGQRPPFPGNGHTGSPWLGENGSTSRPDGLCPDTTVVPGPTRQNRVYPISAIATPIPITKKRVADDGLLFVLNEDKAAVLAGQKPKEPLVVRSNVGDCVDVVFTNEIPDSAVNGDEVQFKTPFSKANMHTHFVQFDPQASDGVISGMSYEQSVRPYATENRRLTAGAAAGASAITVTNTAGLRQGIWLGVGLGQGVCTAPGSTVLRACTEVRRIVTIAGNVLTLDQPLAFPHASGQAVGVEFKRYQWYSDVDSGTVFWHDHITLGGWPRGLFGAHVIEPKGSTYNSPVTGDPVRSGTIVDVRTPANATIGASQVGSFREVFLAITDRDKTREGYINLRAEPFDDRDDKFVFSSVRNGDPFTPLPRAYVGDPVVIRGLGVVEHVGALRLTGNRFRLDRWNPQADLQDTAILGISERFDLVLDGGAGRAGDYLYYSAVGRQFTEGAWGLVRVHDTQRLDLKPLPGRPLMPTGAGFPQQRFTNSPPAKATSPGNPCPTGAVVRHHDVRIVNTNIRLEANKQVSGVAYVLDGGSSPASVTEPLVLRVAAGECLEVQLRNNLSDRAGFNLALLPFDPQGSYGAAIGYNPDSSVGQNETRLYRFYADRELGTAVLLNLATPRTLPKGAYGAVIAEPAGATYTHPVLGTPLSAGIYAEVSAPSGAFRELALLFQDDDPRIGLDHMPYPVDVEGLNAISYSASPLALRGLNVDRSRVFDSSLFGDPKLLARVPAGKAMRLRVAQPWGEQGHVFSLGGHAWPLEPNVPGADRIYARNLLPGVAFEAVLVGGAGGRLDSPGDHLISDHRQPFTEGGLWGILRVE